MLLIMYDTYDSDISIIEATEEEIRFFVGSVASYYVFSKKELLAEQTVLLKNNYQQAEESRLLGRINFIDSKAFIYTHLGSLFIALETRTYLESSSRIKIKVSYLREGYQLERKGMFDIGVVNKQGEQIFQLNQRFLLEAYYTEEATDFIDNRSKIRCIYEQGSHFGFVYQDSQQKIRFNKIYFNTLFRTDKIKQVSVISEVAIKLKMFNNRLVTIDLSKLVVNKPLKLLEGKYLDKLQGDPIQSIIQQNRTRYYVFLKETGVYIQKGQPTQVTQFVNRLGCLSFGKHLYVYGLMFHKAYNAHAKFDYLFTSSEATPLAKFKRPFNRIRILKKLGYFKLNINELNIGDRVHYPLWIGSQTNPIHRLQLNQKKIKSRVYTKLVTKELVYVLRTDIHGSVSYSIVPNNKMYNLMNRIKQKIAMLGSKIKLSQKKTNVYFEKMASKADESAYRVFESVMRVRNVRSKNFFILAKEAKMYRPMKKKYGKHLVAKYSLKHYYLLFKADYYISSDLSNHIINDRIYINEIMTKLKEVPLIFLQHGIMFAKPVENPLGKIFYKEYGAYNVYKNVVSSDLEAFEFYKMGYTSKDLIKTGLATFDYAEIVKNSQKIVYMPTYRYWEEGMIYSGDIEKTTYYASLLNMIKVFEKNGLLDDLILVSHNKFSEYIIKALPEYRHLFADNPSEALKIGRIFISDYSSAIYDAIYRGAYPIFYWKNKDYLSENYQAEPPITEKNAPGPVATSDEELVAIIKEAIATNYYLNNDYLNKYRNINQFTDNRNTERIVNYLLADNIL